MNIECIIEYVSLTSDRQTSKIVKLTLHIMDDIQGSNFFYLYVYTVYSYVSNLGYLATS